MDLISIEGGVPLKGTLTVQGSKNAALPILAASILVPGVTTLTNCPDISDVACMCEILKSIGADVHRHKDVIRIDATQITTAKLPRELVTRMRSSVIFLGALLGRCGRAALYFPGGCVIGDRPIDLHLKALCKLGARMQTEQDKLLAQADRLLGNTVVLDFPSVGATQNVLLSAVLAEGKTEIYHCAREPEIVSLCDFLTGAGAKITGAGTAHITVEGVEALQESAFSVPADRIVAGTYLIAAMAAGGELYLDRAPADQMESLLFVAGQMGAEIEAGAEGLWVRRKEGLRAPEEVITKVYPGFPTDLQSQLLVALCRAEGESVLQEKIFNGRFGVVEELVRMGAKISVEGPQAKIYGPCRLHGCFVTAQELRGGAALVLAGLCADGVTHVCNRQFIDRGYEDICRDLRKLGAKIG